jgi:hypothetical protein
LALFALCLPTKASTRLFSHFTSPFLYRSEYSDSPSRFSTALSFQVWSAVGSRARECRRTSSRHYVFLSRSMTQAGEILDSVLQERPDPA